MRPHRAALALLLAAALAAPAQQRLDDPANLAGERVSPQDPADTLPINHGAPALQQLLRKLRTRASFMLIVAHPDDEDGGMLTYLSRGQGARVAMLTLNRGEGGQNLMSADFDDALGLIRTQELLAADRYMAVDQFFGTEVDFGFSKTKEEAFAKWTHERVLYDAVRAVRLYRPLVIASVFIGAPSDGHGQHQVSGEIAQEVFNAAGDPKVFPDQITAGLQPWQPLKVYARVPFARIDEHGMYDYATNQYTPPRFTNYVTGKVTTTVPKANVVVPEGTPDPLLGGLTYVQFARQGLALQKTQIGQGVRVAPPGRFDVSYHRYGSHLNQPDGDDSGVEPSFFDGIDTSLAGMASLVPEAADKFRPSLEKIDRQIADAQRLFDPAHTELTAPPLRITLGSLDEFIHELENPNVDDLPPDESYNLLHELRIKRVQCNNALVLALGLTLDVVPKEPNPTRGAGFDTVALDATLSTAANERLESMNFAEQPGVEDPRWHTVVGPIDPFSPDHPVHVGIAAHGGPSYRSPYFSRPNHEQPFYDLDRMSTELRNAPETPASLPLFAVVRYSGVLITVPGVSHTGIQPTAIMPPVNVSLNRPILVIRPGMDTFAIQVHIHSDIPSSSQIAIHTPTRIKVSLSLPPGWSAPSLSETLTVPASGHPADFDRAFTITPAVGFASAPQDRQYVIIAQAEIGDSSGNVLDYSEGFRPVGYPGLTYTNYYTPAAARIVPVDVTTAPNLNIAYLPGTGDAVPSALEDLGVHPHLIALADLTPEALKPYDAVVLGVRAYEAHRELAAANAALNAYAAAGGVVIAQYNTGHLPEGTGPYPLDLGHSENVVDETAPVRILAPHSPLLTWPNRIVPADFDGWVEERGHGFMATWDPHYTPLLETHDPGQQPQQGGLLVARTGKGAWIYLGLALYRQLPEGVPGPYRLLANLISAARNPAYAVMR